jgi:hypothetical protein
MPILKIGSHAVKDEGVEGYLHNDGAGNISWIAGTAGGGGGNTILVFDDSIFKVTGTALVFQDGLVVHITGSYAYIDWTGTSFPANALGYLHNDGAGLLTWDAGTGGGGGNTLLIYDNSVFKVTGTAIVFQDGLVVRVTGSIAYVDWTGTVGGNVATDVIWDAKGDLAVGTGADAAIRLAVGATGTVLISDPSTATRLRWGGAVAAMYQTTGTSTYPSGTGTFVNFPNQVYDTDSTVTVGVAWKFTAPITGYYHVDAAIIYVTTTAWALGEVARLQIYKNAAAYLIIGRRDDMNSGATTQQMAVQGSCDVQLNTGDYIQIEEYQASGGNLALNANLTQNYVCIHLIR